MKRIAFVLLLAGCAPEVMSSTPNSIVLSGVHGYNRSKAFPIAQAHCAQSGKNASQLPDTLRDGFVTFECIE